MPKSHADIETSLLKETNGYRWILQKPYLLAYLTYNLFQTLSAELQKLHTDIGDKKDDLLKSITSAGGNSERFSQCFSNLQAWLQLTQTAAASRSESMKTEMDHYINYQVSQG